MNKNYEIKCKLNAPNEIKKYLVNINNCNYTFENQTDIYYKVNNGRLKLRIINDRIGNLIFYDRREKTNKRISKYLISTTNNFKELDEILRKQFEVLVSVHKKRNIFIMDNIRAHVDYVKNLGTFLEIEIIYKDFSKARMQMKGIISYLNLNEKDFIKESYSDMLINKK